jgi:hypothetical protein
VDLVKTGKQDQLGLDVKKLEVSATEMGSGGTYNATLHIEATKLGSGSFISYGAGTLTHDFQFTIVTDPGAAVTRILKNCFSKENSEETNCEAVGGTVLVGSTPPCATGWMQTAAQVVQTIQQVKKVGIGTKNPTAELDVTGPNDAPESLTKVQSLIIKPVSGPNPAPTSPSTGQIWLQ